MTVFPATVLENRYIPSRRENVGAFVVEIYIPSYISIFLCYRERSSSASQRVSESVGLNVVHLGLDFVMGSIAPEPLSSVEYGRFFISSGHTAARGRY